VAEAGLRLNSRALSWTLSPGTTNSASVALSLGLGGQVRVWMQTIKNKYSDKTQNFGMINKWKWRS
jgi:hypothetical protein